MTASQVRADIARRAAAELVSGQYVNLGIGIPTLIADMLGEDSGILFHSENGILGMRGLREEEVADGELVDAGKRAVAIEPGGAFFDQSLSFAMIRGGYIDVAVLGAFEVSTEGDLASWSLGEGQANGVGGAMDLAAGAKKVLVTMLHRNSAGEDKLVRACRYPLTAKKAVDLVFTDLGVFEPIGDAFRVRELASGVTPEALAQGADPGLYVFDATESER